MLKSLVRKGFQIEFHSHAKAILSQDFPESLSELEEILRAATIPIAEIIGSGGGETKGTQRLRRGLASKNWTKFKFTIEKKINGETRESISHEVDHVRNFKNGVVALEIEWNNKDPFFDRDLENFKRLHAETAISVGVIVTRGESLQNEMKQLVGRFARENKVLAAEDLARFGLLPTPRQRDAVLKLVGRERNPRAFGEAWAGQFVSDKYGTATTHWQKLQDRVRRGVGNPCPLLLIGLPASIVTFETD